MYTHKTSEQSTYARTLEEVVDAGEREGEEGLDAQKVGQLHHLIDA